MTVVVPAKAGTHTPRPFVGHDRSCLRNNEVLWLWVPAFAGTTMIHHPLAAPALENRLRMRIDRASQTSR